MRFSEQRIDSLILSEYLLDIEDVDNVYLGDMFFDEEVEVIILKNFMREVAFDKLVKLTEDISRHTFTCGKCSKTVVDNCIRCDNCLIWYDYRCVGIKASTDDSILGSADYYCYKCEKL